MQNAGLGIIVALALVAVSAGFGRSSANGQHAGRTENLSSDGRMLAFAAPASDGGQQITLIDQHEKVMSVYHVDATSGTISLRSVRNIRWDLLVEWFNGGSPPPQEIRALVEQRR